MRKADRFIKSDSLEIMLRSEVIKFLGRYLLDSPIEWIKLFLAAACHFALILGVVCLLIVQFQWPKIQNYYSESRSKFFISFFRALSGVVVLAEKGSTNPYLSSIAIVNFLIWESVGIFGDQKKKTSIQIQQKKSEDNEKTIIALRIKGIFGVKLLEASRGILHLKKQQIRRVLAARASSKQQKAQRLQKALDPRFEMQSIVQQLTFHLIFESRSLTTNFDPVNSATNINFRAALLVEDQGHLNPIVCYDYNTKRTDHFSSMANHREDFRVDNKESPSLAVKALQLERMLIVSNCTNDNLPGFRFFNQAQRRYLKSMVAYPIMNFGCDSDGSDKNHAVLIVDTNREGYFSDDMSDTLALLLGEFAVHLDLEYSILSLFK